MGYIATGAVPARTTKTATKQLAVATKTTAVATRNPAPSISSTPSRGSTLAVATRVPYERPPNLLDPVAPTTPKPSLRPTPTAPQKLAPVTTPIARPIVRRPPIVTRTPKPPAVVEVPVATTTTEDTTSSSSGGGGGSWSTQPAYIDDEDFELPTPGVDVPVSSGINVKEVAIIGALAVAAYFAYQKWGK